MANEYAVDFRPSELAALALGTPCGAMDDPFGYVDLGLLKGTTFGPKVTQSVFQAFRVPNAAALTTGLTVSLLVSDDPNNPSVGKVAVFGVTIGPVTSGTTTLDENATTGPFVSTTEVTGSLTLPATSGVALVGSIAVPIANMNSLAVGGWAVIRVRRLGANASETHVGRVVLLGVNVRAT